ncbi:MAG: tetratricopeptide repeat protein, partial [Armatimonadota bacterium]|nr:tetratricopeptide repeat protein [Armatimonadota bacterium]
MCYNFLSDKVVGVMEMCRKVLALYVALLWLIYPAWSQTSPVKLWVLFENAKNLFWQVEPRFHVNFNPIESLPPLSPNHPDVARYRRAAQAAEKFLAEAGPKSDSKGVPIMLYFAAMSYSRISEHEKALFYINRLLRDYPDYKRPRMEGYPEEDRPVKADLLHLKLWHQSQLKQYAKQAKQKDQTPLAVLKSVAQEGVAAVRAAAERRPPQQYLDLEWLSPTPDQLRAAALPSVKEIVSSIHDELLPTAIKTNGTKAVRDYLRELNGAGEPVASYAVAKLLEIDRVILAEYRQEAAKSLRERRFDAAKAVYRRIISEYSGTEAARLAEADLQKAIIAQYHFGAETALKAKRFDEAKAAYRRIIAEYPGTEEARLAEAELQKIVPVAVAYYKSEGDKNFRPEAPNQFGVPQTKAREYFEKMYKEDPASPQADYA